MFTKYRLLSFLCNRLGISNAHGDSFNWEIYNLHYKEEMASLTKVHTLNLKPGDYKFTGNKLAKINDKIKDLHPNWFLVYQTVMQLTPRTIREIGCGNGMHLNNIKTLNPTIKLFGVDRSEKQIDLLNKSYPALNANIKIVDITKEGIFKKLNKVDVAFTQAVLMHICANEKTYFNALVNIFNSTNKHVLLMEKLTKRPFVKDIIKLHKDGFINWPALKIRYIKYNKGDPKIIICSKV